jgi:hypothetical protein
MSRNALARLSGVRPECLSRIKAGTRLTHVHSLRAIATVFGVSPGWLVFGDGPWPGVPETLPENQDQRPADPGADLPASRSQAPLGHAGQTAKRRSSR